MLIHGSTAPEIDKWSRVAEVTTGYLHVVGSISSMPAVSIGSVSTGSESYLYGKSGTNWYPLAVQSGTEGILRIAGTFSATTGSESYIKGGSIQVYASNIYTGSKGPITSGNNILLINKTINTGSTFIITGIDLTGTADGRFSLMENNKLITQYRTNTSEQNIKRNLNISFTSGGSIMVFVEHGEALSQGFLGAMYGYEI